MRGFHFLDPLRGLDRVYRQGLGLDFRMWGLGFTQKPWALRLNFRMLALGFIDKLWGVGLRDELWGLGFRV